MSVPTHVPPRCRSCSAILTPPGHTCASCGTVQAQEPRATQQAQVPAKSAGVAVLLSLLWFGAGHLYANQPGAGIALAIYDGFLVLLAITLFGLVIAVPLWLLSAPIVATTAAAAANNYNRRTGATAQ